MVPAKDFKRRMVVEIDGAPHMIEQIQVQTPSARGAATLYKIKARNLKTKARVEKAYRGTDSLSESSFERRPVQFLYRDAEAFHFMDAADFNQFSLPADDLSDQASYMTENMEGVEALVVNDEVIAIEIPDTVVLEIVETSPGRPGQLGYRADQARHAGHRGLDPGARAPRPGGHRQRRHPDRRVPGPGQLIALDRLTIRRPRGGGAIRW